MNKRRGSLFLPVELYPLQRKFALCGLVVGAVGAALFKSPLAGLAFFVLFLNAGLLWRRNEAPILPFCLAYQWLYAVLGYLFFRASGRYPSSEKIGNLEGAVALSLVGLSVLAVGLRLGLYCWDKSDLRRNNAVLAGEPHYDIPRLFLVTCIGGVTAFLWRKAPIDVWFGGAQILYRLLEFRTILLALLLFCVLRQRKGYGYGIVAALVAWVSSFGSVMSSFSLVLILLFVVLLREWQPWLSSAQDRQRNVRVLLAAIGVAAVTLVLGAIWEGGVKSAWRGQVLNEQGEIVGRTGAKEFIQTVKEEAPLVEFKSAFASVWARMSSDVMYFSYVLERVPSMLPHENGMLTRRALLHILVPRFLYPEKLNLGSDSWLVIYYAGVPAADVETGASIGLGYIAEFYIDFGVPWMFLPLLVYGVLIALAYRSLQLVSPSYPLWMSAALVMCLATFTTFGGEIAKLFGALVTCVIMYGLILKLFGGVFHRWLLAAPVDLRGRDPALERRAVRQKRWEGVQAQGSEIMQRRRRRSRSLLAARKGGVAERT
jgi:hypothetical protein